MPIAGALVGQAISEDDRQNAQNAYKKALESISGINIPQQLQLNLEAPQYTGTYNPALEEAVQQGPSAMQNVSTDPRLAKAQMDALAQMQQIGQVGMTDEEKAQLASNLRQTDADQQARQASIMQNLQARGLGGSGSELAQKLMASQGGAQQANENALNLAGQAQQRQLQAIAQSGSLGGQVRGQEFGEQAQKASAADTISQFNALQKAATQARNAQSLTGAQQYGAMGKQGAENARAQAQQQAAAYNVAAPSRMYEQQMARGSALSGLYTSQADRDMKEAQAKREMAEKAGEATQKAGTSMAGAMIASDENLKEKIRDGSGKIRAFLDEIEPHTYEYKDPEKFGEGERVGVMAQDLEKSELGKPMVKNTSEGKMVDFGAGLSAILAAQADLNNRLKKLEGRG